MRATCFLRVSMDGLAFLRFLCSECPDHLHICQEASCLLMNVGNAFEEVATILTDKLFKKYSAHLHRLRSSAFIFQKKKKKQKGKSCRNRNLNFALFPFPWRKYFGRLVLWSWTSLRKPLKKALTFLTSTYQTSSEES